MILAINMNPAIDKVYAVDDYRVGKVFRPRAMTATAGGKGLNVARVAHLLGEKVTVTGMIGGSTGRRIEEEMRKEGLDSRFVPIEGESRICINVMDEKNNTSTEILEPGPVVTAEEGEAFLARYRKLLEECSVVTASVAGRLLCDSHPACKRTREKIYIGYQRGVFPKRNHGKAIYDKAQYG